jgi:hypothetical protein
MTRVTEAHARRLAGAAERAQDRPKRTRGPTPRPKPTAALRESPGEAALAAALRLHGKDLPAPEREYVFAPPRRWRADFRWTGLLVEVDGGTYAPGGGRHAGDKDKEKTNMAAVLGYRLLRFSPQQIAADPAGCVDLIRRCLCPR